MKYIYIILFNLIFTQVHFVDVAANTGINHLVIIENVLGLEPGDEIGLFDSNGLTNSGDCTSEYGELLVGAGIYTGEQLNIVGVGSVDYCDFEGGYQLAGWVENNPITIKVWDASQDYEYVVTPAFENDNNLWNGTFSVINTLIVNELSASEINNFLLFNAYPNPFNPSITFDINHIYNSNLIITVYNLSGQSIYNAIYNPRQKKSIVWDASNYNSGIYLVKIHNESISLTKKIMLIK